MVGGFAMPPGGLQPPGAAPPAAAPPAAAPPAASAEGGPQGSEHAKNAAFQKTIIGGIPAMAPIAPPAQAPTAAADEPAPEAPSATPSAWSHGDEDTPPGGVGGPVQAGGLGATKNLAFQQTMVGGMPAMTPPPPAAAESPAAHASSATPAAAEAPEQPRAPRLDPEPRRAEASRASRESMPSAPPVKPLGSKLVIFLIVGLLLAIAGAYAVGKRIGVISGVSESEAVVDTHRFALRGQLQLLRFSCAEDPSGATAAGAMSLPAGSPLGAAACKATDATLEAFSDPDRSPGAILATPPAEIATAEGKVQPSTCVEFISGEAHVVTCTTHETRLQIADLRDLDKVK
jgi:hypothetical protein